MKAVSSFFKGDEKKDKKEKKKPEMKELKGEDKRRALEKLEYQKKRRDVIRAHGFGSDELKALESERLEQIGKNTYPDNIVSTNNNGKKISSVEAYASYENGGEEVVVIPPQENTETSSQPEKGIVYPVMTGSGSGGNADISARLYERG